MNGLARNVAKWVGGIFSPRPAIFDFLLSGILVAPFMRHGTMQEVFFVFYILFLWSASLMIEPKRRCKSRALSLLCLWTMAGVFIHSFTVSETSIARQYLNLYLLSEGFIYILAACIFLFLCVTYSRNLRFAWVLIPFSLIPFVQNYIAGSRVSAFAALIIATMLYFFSRKRWGYLAAIIIASSGILAVAWSHIFLKFSCRPYIWTILLESIQRHPWIGSGFPHLITFDNMHYVFNAPDVNRGWTYNHNDYLAFASFVGIPGLLLVLFFTTHLLSKAWGKVVFIPAFAITILCFFQMTMFDIGKAAVALVVIALIILSVHKQEEICAK